MYSAVIVFQITNIVPSLNWQPVNLLHACCSHKNVILNEHLFLCISQHVPVTAAKGGPGANAAGGGRRVHGVCADQRRPADAPGVLPRHTHGSEGGTQEGEQTFAVQT